MIRGAGEGEVEQARSWVLGFLGSWVGRGEARPLEPRWNERSECRRCCNGNVGNVREENLDLPRSSDHQKCARLPKKVLEERGGRLSWHGMVILHRLCFR
jgi:hypothetical protein